MTSNAVVKNQKDAVGAPPIVPRMGLAQGVRFWILLLLMPGSLFAELDWTAKRSDSKVEIRTVASASLPMNAFTVYSKSGESIKRTFTDDAAGRQIRIEDPGSVVSPQTNLSLDAQPSEIAENNEIKTP